MQKPITYANLAAGSLRATSKEIAVWRRIFLLFSRVHGRIFLMRKNFKYAVFKFTRHSVNVVLETFIFDYEYEFKYKFDFLEIFRFDFEYEFGYDTTSYTGL